MGKKKADIFKALHKKYFYEKMKKQTTKISKNKQQKH